MLYSVPRQINSLTRSVVRRHPNSMSAVAYRKIGERIGEDQTNGNDTLGGLTVLSTTDEEQFRYERLGRCRVLPAEGFQPASMAKTADANIGAVDEYRFMIEPTYDSGHEEFFTPKNHDVFYILLMGEEDGPHVAFEIVGIETTSNIPPFTQRYVCNRRDDLFL